MGKTSCKKGQYYCNTDQKCKPIPDGYKVREDGFLVSEGSNPRIPRKAGQPAKSKKHSDLYTDEDPKGTIQGLGFKDVATAKASVAKIRKSSRSHAHKIQAAIAMEQRARVMGKSAEAAVYRKFINSMKKKTKKMNEEKHGDHEPEMIRSQLKTASRASKRIEKHSRKKENFKAWVQSKITKASDYLDTAADYLDGKDVKEASSPAQQAAIAISMKKKGKKPMNEGSLRKWFKGSKSKDGKGGWVNVVTGGTCASDEPGEGTPKCVSSSKRASMSKKERLSASRRKKKADPDQQSKSGAAKPTYVSTDKKKKKMKEEFISLPLQLEVPQNDGEFRLGLMFRESLEQDRGMLFVFETTDHHSFHMKNTFIPLDIAFINEEGIIESIKELNPMSSAPVYPDGKIRYAVEVNRGWFAENGVVVGDILLEDIQEHHKKDADGNTIPHEEEELNEVKDKKGKGSGTKDACYHKVKSRYSVWPSAYASGALVKCRKVGAANWGNKSESVEVSGENVFERSIVPEKVKQEYRRRVMEKKPGTLTNKVGISTNMEGYYDWRSTLDEKCWAGYEKKGMKTMFGKRYPNCVKKSKSKPRKEEIDYDQVIEGSAGVLKDTIFPKKPKEKKMSASLLDNIRKVNTGAGSQYESVMTKSQIKKRDEIADAISKKDMEKRYGDESVKYAIATKLAMKEDITDEALKIEDWNVDDIKFTEVEAVDIIKPEPLKPSPSNIIIDEGFKTRLVMKLGKKLLKKFGKVNPFTKTGAERVTQNVRKYIPPDKITSQNIQTKSVVNQAKKLVDTSIKPNKGTKPVTVDLSKKIDFDKYLGGTQNKIKKKFGTKPTGTFTDDLPPVKNGKPKKPIKDHYDWRGQLETELDEDWQKVNRKDKTDGLSQKAVNAYRKENPGSKLKTAVTKDPKKLKKGSKSAKRRLSFCRRMKGMKKKLTSAKTSRDPDSRINKALRRWNC